MVIKKDLAPFLAWLFGPEFEHAGLQRALPAVIFLVAMMLLAGGLLFAARHGSALGPAIGVGVRRPGRGALVVLALLRLAAWERAPSFLQAIGERLIGTLVWFFGEKWYRGAF